MDGALVGEVDSTCTAPFRMPKMFDHAIRLGGFFTYSGLGGFGSLRMTVCSGNVKREDGMAALVLKSFWRGEELPETGGLTSSSLRIDNVDIIIILAEINVVSRQSH